MNQHLLENFSNGKNTETKPQNTDGTKIQGKWQKWILVCATWNIEGIKKKKPNVLSER